MSYPRTLAKEVAQGQHYVLFSSYESRNSIEKRGLMKSSIALYIPPGSLQITTGQTYSDIQGGATMARARSGGFAADDFTSGFENFFEKTGRILQGGADVATGMLTKPEMAQNFASAAFGLAKNNHVALAYKGPNAFRTHSFTFQFFPKTDDEAKDVREIIDDFQNGSTPRLAGGIVDNYGRDSDVTRLTAPFFASPRQYEIKFMMGGRSEDHKGGKENPFLYELKRSVITSMTINHDPNSVVSFHNDGSPVHSTMTLSLQEIEYVTSKDKVSDERNTTASSIATQMQVNQMALGSRPRQSTIAGPGSSKVGSSTEINF